MNKYPPNQHIPMQLQLSHDVISRAVKEYGTPLYIYDDNMLELRWKQLKSILPEDVLIHYSVKANPNVAIINKFRELGTHFEIASLYELVAATSVCVSPSNIIFVGPGKSLNDLQYAINLDLNIIVVESMRELNDIQLLAKRLDKKPRVALRINPGTGKGRLSMGGATQFGIAPKTVLQILSNSSSFPDVGIVGLHVYLGTGILDWQVILENSRLITELADQLQRQSGASLTFLDIGGGFGIPYYEKDQPLDFSALAVSLSSLLQNYKQRHPYTEVIAVESGRFLVGSAGVFVATVLDVKKNGDNWFVILDGGINVFGGYDIYAGLRPLPIHVLGRPDKEIEPINVCGPLCTPMDRLATAVMLPMPEVGDLLVFYQAGAYGLTASPGLFLSHGYPREVLVKDRNVVMIRESTSADDLLRSQKVPFCLVSCIDNNLPSQQSPRWRRQGESDE